MSCDGAPGCAANAGTRPAGRADEIQVRHRGRVAASIGSAVRTICIATPVRRSVVHPTPLWTWSLVWRRCEDNAAVRAVIDAFIRHTGELGVDDAAAWLPAADPHHPHER
jgi:hypothetical protein